MFSSQERFDKFFEIVVGLEGGYVNDPRDPGGETKYGVSKRAYPNVDIKNLTIEGAKAIYKRDYFDKLPILLPIDLHLSMFDMAINSGVSAAVQLYNRGNKSATRYNSARIKFYTSIRNFGTFGRGWMNRLSHIIESGQELLEYELEEQRPEYDVLVVHDSGAQSVSRKKFVASIDGKPIQIKGSRLDVRFIV